jgi:hypothetical protein
VREKIQKAKLEREERKQKRDAAAPACSCSCCCCSSATEEVQCCWKAACSSGTETVQCCSKKAPASLSKAVGTRKRTRKIRRGKARAAASPFGLRKRKCCHHCQNHERPAKTSCAQGRRCAAAWFDLHQPVDWPTQSKARNLTAICNRALGLVLLRH